MQHAEVKLVVSGSVTSERTLLDCGDEADGPFWTRDLQPGVQHGVRGRFTEIYYKRLMLHRIAWTEAAQALGEKEVKLADGEDGAGANEGGGEKALDGPSSGGVSLEGNRCDLVWEGPVRERAFTNFRPRSCPTDSAARDALGAKFSLLCSTY